MLLLRYPIPSQCSVLVTITLPLLLSFPSPVHATSFNDFVNNLSTDLAPLITLFGEQATKQFLSESTSILDNVIFAMAPLGILTAVVSAIRVSQNPALKAFIGRAQEGRAAAEIELLSSTSDTVSELWEMGGIARVYGQPKVLEIVKGEARRLPGLTRSSDRAPLSRLQDVMLDDAASSVSETDLSQSSTLKPRIWTIDRDHSVFSKPSEYKHEDREALLDMSESFALCPNLSLNVGRETRPMWWTISVLVTGVVLQAGTIVYGGLSVYYDPLRTILTNDNTDNGSTRQHSSTSIQPWAFPLTWVGTIAVSAGMFVCALLINRETDEVFLKRHITADGSNTSGQHMSDRPKATNGEIFWLQAEQKVGDQTFPAYVGRNFRTETYVRSTISRNRRGSSQRPRLALFVAVGLTMIGFVLQFVGLRYLHASVALANLSATLIMAVLRATLRTQRKTASRNELEFFDPSHKTGNELLDFIRILVDYDDRMFELSPLLKIPRPEAFNHDDPTYNKSRELVKTYASLVSLPSVKSEWANGDTISVAAKLKVAIEDTVAYITDHLNKNPIPNDCCIQFDCLRIPGHVAHYSSPVPAMLSWSTRRCRFVIEKFGVKPLANPVVESVHVRLTRSSEGYHIDTEGLEAVLSLWHHTRTALSEPGQDSFRRIVGWFDNLDEDSKRAAVHEYNLWTTGFAATDLALVSGLFKHQEAFALSHSERLPQFPLYNQPLKYPKSNYFGWQAFEVDSRDPPTMEPYFLTVGSQSSSLLMCAQDLYLSFLATFAVFLAPATEDDISIDASNGTDVRCQSRRLEDLSLIFAESGLGPRSDALSCIYPALKRASRQPDLHLKRRQIRRSLEVFTDPKARSLICRWAIQGQAPHAGSFAYDLASEACKSLMAQSLDCQHDIIFLLEHTSIDLQLKAQIKWIIGRNPNAHWEKLLDLQSISSYNGLPDIHVPEGSWGDELCAWANSENYVLINRYLIMRGSAGVDSVGIDGQSSMIWATKRADIGQVEWLINERADVNQQDNLGRTPIHYAAAMGHLEMVRLFARWKGLGDSYCQTQKADHTGETPLEACVRTDQGECFRILSEHCIRFQKGNRLTINPETHETIYHLIAARGALECWSSLTTTMVPMHPEILLYSDADGRTPLDVASAHSNTARETLMKTLMRSECLRPRTEEAKAAFVEMKRVVKGVFPDRVWGYSTRPSWWDFGVMELFVDLD